MCSLKTHIDIHSSLLHLPAEAKAETRVLKGILLTCTISFFISFQNNLFLIYKLKDWKYEI